MYSTHITELEKGSLEYHMCQLRTFAMTDSKETFLRGAKAYRNLRDSAKEQRDNAIQRANQIFRLAQQPQPQSPKSVSSDQFESAQSSQEDDAASGCERPRKRSHVDLTD